ncbi:unannotated protein [freshwater metagenome]|uniref:Unannotated protein n=1 Tax=freshwater metagenome TaxID=449393 RepID=A0A6J7DFG8_9ZZZZ
MHLLHGEGPGILGDPNRVADPVAGLGGEDRYARPLGHHAQLIDRVGALEIGGHEQWSVTLPLELKGELAREGRLAGALKPGEQDHGRRRFGEVYGAGLATEHGDELLMHDLHDLLGRVQRPRCRCGQGPLLDHGGERSYD